MHNIIYSNQAKLDLEQAIAFIAKESKINALEYLLRYEEKIKLLKLNPSMGVDCKNKLIKQDCKIPIHESHIIIYKIGMDEILIIRIFHSAENYANKI